MHATAGFAYDCYETKRLLMNLKLTPPRYRELSPMELNGKKTPGGAGTHKGHTVHTDAYLEKNQSVFRCGRRSVRARTVVVARGGRCALA